MDSKRIILDFKEHKDEVSCCAGSPDEQLVVSCDISSVLLVKLCNFVYDKNLSFSAIIGMGGQNW